MAGGQGVDEVGVRQQPGDLLAVDDGQLTQVHPAGGRGARRPLMRSAVPATSGGDLVGRAVRREAVRRTVGVHRRHDLTPRSRHRRGHRADPGDELVDRPLGPPRRDRLEAPPQLRRVGGGPRCGRLERPGEIALALGLGEVGEEHEPRRHHVRTEPLARPVAQLHRVVDVHLVEVHDVVDVEHGQARRLAERLDELGQVRPGDRDQVAAGDRGGGEVDHPVADAVLVPAPDCSTAPRRCNVDSSRDTVLFGSPTRSATAETPAGPPARQRRIGEGPLDRLDRGHRRSVFHDAGQAHNQARLCHRSRRMTAASVTQLSSPAGYWGQVLR